METCETIGVELSEEDKVLYFMNNLNDSKFGDAKANFMDLSFPSLSTRASPRGLSYLFQIDLPFPESPILTCSLHRDPFPFGEMRSGVPK